MLEICTENKDGIMKKKLSLILFILTVALNLKVSATNGQLSRNYVVIGAFSIPKNAIDFTNSAKQKNLAAEFSINPIRKLFYVYVLATPNQEAAIEEAKKLRKDPSYSDTWVFTGILGEEEIQKGADTNPVTRETIQVVKPSDGPANSQTDVTTASLTQEPTISVTQPVVSSVPETTAPAVVEEIEPGSKKFLFKIITSKDQKEIQGDVDVMDLDKTKPRKVASYRGNEVVNVKPANQSGNVSFVCEVFGYRKLQTPVNFNQPEATEGITVEENKAVMPFELVRLKKGDYAVMYNVYFYKDAGIMRPESKYEVNSLLEMLKENPKYKIRIHGHTNGNAAGKVISMGDSKNFFGINADVKEGFGSAKKLSEERAKVIQSYLVSQGISIHRMQIKAWGGKRPIYEVDHNLAQANVRVEIEILED
ncbi:MAG: OmpA family protein [Bacteroidetes bacterium]|nr:OmpA family protein [Bacteroidota bacterium]